MLDGIIRTMESHLFGFDTGAFRLTLAAALANYIERRPPPLDDEMVVVPVMPLDPVWLMLVGAPSTGKTEMINALSGWRNTHSVQQLTPHTLVSGNPKANHLIQKINRKVLLIKDMASVLTMHERDGAQLIAQFTQIYDGHISASWGSSRGQFEWRGKIGVVAGTTEIIYDSRSMISRMGDRFLYLSLKMVPGHTERRAISRSAIDNIRGTMDSTWQQDVKNQVHLLMSELVSEPIYSDSISVPAAVTSFIGVLVDFATIMRGTVPRDPYRRTVTRPPETEGTPRMTKEIFMLCQALAVLDRRREVTQEDMALARRTAIDCAHRSRRSIVSALFNVQREARRTRQSTDRLSMAEICKMARLAYSTATIEVDDLVILDLVQRHGNGTNATYSISSFAAESIGQIMGVRI